MSPVEINEIEKLTIQILAVLNGTSIEKLKESLIDITADGEITEDEVPRLKIIISSLDDIAVKSQALKLWAEKYLMINLRKE